ncbi:MAG: dockerin type I repeat-containing protein, partial [Desulfatibacillaceae bacterium]|nr:dockerin type I repeat-containing protein [Desulfatibacillaceae bacterium]
TTGTYVQHVGSLQVFIEPQGARDAGAQWRVNGGAWQNPGAVVPNLPVGDYAIDFKTVYGWDTPAADTVTVLKDQTGDTTGTYVQQTGWLRVTLEPEAAVLDGALWGFVDEPIPARSSGDSVLKFVDTYGIHFNDIAGWETPGVQVVDVLNNVTVDAFARYLPKPVLVSPADGAVDVAVKPTLRSAEVGPALLPPGFVHNRSRWQISKTPAFAKSDLVLDFTDTQLTDFFVDWLALAANTTYWWRVKYLDTAAGLESGWADAFTFTTQAVAPIKGDVNGDRFVNDADLKLIRALVGVRCGNPKYVAAADLDGNCRIDSMDITLWYKAYNDFKAGRY